MGNTFREKIVEEGLEEPAIRNSRQPQTPPVPPVEEDEEEETDDTMQSDEEESSTQSRHQRSNSSAGSKSFNNIMGGNVLKSKWVIRQIPLILLIAFYCLLLVSNRYWVENLSREKIATEENINYLREERMQMQKDFQESIKISHIAEKLDTLGIKLISGPPYEIEDEPQQKG